MDKNITIKLKELMKVKNWSEIKTKEQFYILVSYMHCIEEAVNEDIIMSIDNIEMLIEEYFNDYIELTIDLEPSIMVAIVDTNSFIMEMFEKDDKPEIRKKIAHELKNFSQWLVVDSKVKYSIDNETYIASVFEALEVVKRNHEDKNLKLNLIAEKRQDLLKDLQELVKYGIDFGDSPYFKAKTDSYGSSGYYEEIDDYEEDYYLN